MNAAQMRTRLLTVLASLSTVVLLSGCGGSPVDSPSPSEGPRAGGELVIAANGEMPGFDPVKLVNVGYGIERAAAVMDTLMFRNEETGEVTPKLARGMQSEDGLNWMLTLREGVDFTDGTPLDAEAVIFNVQRHLDEASASTGKRFLSGVESMEQTGEFAVTFTLRQPDGSFPLVFSAATPVGLIGSPAALADPEAFNTKPVGAGPFVFSSWERDNELRLESNPDYFDGVPYLDAVTYRVTPDPQSIVDNLLSGGVHVGWINADGYPAIENSDALTLYPPTGGGTALIPNGTRPIGDERVRKAIAMAFDPDRTRSVIFPGVADWGGDLACVPFSHRSPVCTTEGLVDYDVEEAQRLVAEWQAAGNDPRVELTYFTNLSNQATYVQAELRSIGLDVQLRPVDTPTLAEVQAAGDYDLLWGSISSAGFPNYWDRLHSSARNWGKVVYPELDAALDQGRAALTNEERSRGWSESLRIARDKAMVTWVVPSSTSVVLSDSVHVEEGLAPWNGSTMLYLDRTWLEK